MAEALFGTDGFRDIANKSEVTGMNPATLGRLAHTYVCLEHERTGELPTFIVGSDTRVSSARLREAVAHGAALAGAEVWELGVAATPVIGKEATVNDVYAMIVTASHNPAQDNGLKIMARGGIKPVKEGMTELEERYYASLGREPKQIMPYYRRIYRPELIDDYVDRAVDFVGADALEGKSVIIDGANGSVWRTIERFYKRLGATVHGYALSNDGANINNGCGAAHLEGARQFIRDNPDISHEKNSLGTHVFDGDGDRFLALDAEGREINGDHVLNELSVGQVGIVATYYANPALREAVEARGVEFHECENGDSYVTAKLIQLTKERGAGFVIGGEKTGHIVQMGWTSTGDGQITGARVAAQGVAEGRTLAEVYDRLPMWPENMVNIRVDNAKGKLETARVKDTIAAVEAELGEDGRVIVRVSGTEASLARVFAVTRPSGVDPKAVTARIAEAIRAA
jgi:phosphoglucosamine mutase